MMQDFTSLAVHALFEHLRRALLHRLHLRREERIVLLVTQLYVLQLVRLLAVGTAAGIRQKRRKEEKNERGKICGSRI